MDACAQKPQVHLFLFLSNSSTLATSCEELTHWKRLWCWEGLGAGGKGDDRGWDGWMASPTRWTWVWVNSRRWWWTGRPGVLRFTGSQRVGRLRDWTELNWTDVGTWACTYTRVSVRVHACTHIHRVAACFPGLCCSNNYWCFPLLHPNANKLKLSLIYDIQSINSYYSFYRKLILL